MHDAHLVRQQPTATPDLGLGLLEKIHRHVFLAFVGAEKFLEFYITDVIH